MEYPKWAALKMAWDVTHPSLGWQTPTVELIRINQLVRAHDPYSEWLQAQNIYDIYDNIYQNDILKIFIEYLTRPEFVSHLLCMSESYWQQMRTCLEIHRFQTINMGYQSGGGEEIHFPMMTWNLNLHSFAYQIQTTSSSLPNQTSWQVPELRWVSRRVQKVFILH